MGGSGESAQNLMQQGGGLSEAVQQGQAGIMAKGGVAEALAKFGQGGMTMEQALAAAKQGGLGSGDPQETARIQAALDNVTQLKAKRGGEASREELATWDAEIAQGKRQLADMQKRSGAETSAFLQSLATDPLAGSQFAEQQVLGSQLSKGLYGDQGLQGRLVSEEQRLGSEGFGLTPQDREAMAQAGGDITRQFGQQESNLAQTLAARGLGGSNAAAAAFTGLGGSKMEQLSRMQMDIAKERETRAQQRLAQTREQMMGLGQLGQQSLQNQFGRQLAGRGQSAQEQQAAAAQAFQRQQANQQQANQQFQQQQDTKGPGIGGILGKVAGTALGSFGGSAGASLGGGFGEMLGGVADGKK